MSKLRVAVCTGAHCKGLGVRALADAAKEAALGLPGRQKGDVHIGPAGCLGACAQAPVVRVQHELLLHTSPEQVRKKVSTTWQSARRRAIRMTEHELDQALFGNI